MENISLKAVSTMPSMSWGYSVNAGYYYAPSISNISYTDTNTKKQ